MVRLQCEISATFVICSPFPFSDEGQQSLLNSIFPTIHKYLVLKQRYPSPFLVEEHLLSFSHITCRCQMETIS